MSLSVGKSGIISTTGISESLINPLDPEFYYEPDNTAWIRIFHHANPQSIRFNSTDSFTTSVYLDNNRWFNVALCNLVNKWEILVKQMASTGGTEQKYRWVQTKNPMEAAFADVAAANITKNTSTGYTTQATNYGGFYKHNSNTYLACNNGTNGNWWGAVGSWSVHQNGIPAYNGIVVLTGYFDVYLRVDNISPPTKTSIYNNALLSNSIIEV